MSAYELFFKYSMDMCVMAGHDGYFKHANPAFCAMMGRSEEELGSCVKSVQPTKLGAFKEQNLNANFSNKANYANNAKKFAPFAQFA